MSAKSRNSEIAPEKIGGNQGDNGLSRRNVLLAGTMVAAAAAVGSAGSIETAQAQQQQPTTGAAGRKPNIVFMMVDNFGYGDLGCYGGGRCVACRPRGSTSWRPKDCG